MCPVVHAQYPYLLAEMYAYSMAAANLSVPHAQVHHLMVSNVEAGGEGCEARLRGGAVRKGRDLFQLESLVVENAKVKQSGTKAQNVKFYEVPKPKTTKGDQIDLASMTNTGR